MTVTVVLRSYVGDRVASTPATRAVCTEWYEYNVTTNKLEVPIGLLNVNSSNERKIW